MSIFHGKVSLSVNPCLPFDRVFCQSLLAVVPSLLGCDGDQVVVLSMDPIMSSQHKS